MSKPRVIVDAHWRSINELFAPSTWADFNARFDVVWGKDEPMPQALIDQNLPTVFAYVASEPQLDAERLAGAGQLKVVAEVAGHFPSAIDYEACARNGVEAISCAPGFKQSVAEMGVAMALSMARGLVREHEAFRSGDENWLSDCAGEDFSMVGAPIGFVGYGSIAREVHRMLTPFRPQVACYDPWLAPDRAAQAGVELVELDALMAHARCLFITAAPTRENYQMVGAPLLAKLADNSLVVLLSRSHLVDFEALLGEAHRGRLKAAIDVFPNEPIAADHHVRQMGNVVLSPHRAAAVDGGRRLIGEMLLKDLNLVASGKAPQYFNRAASLDVAAMAGVGDAASVVAMAAQR
ncbi:MAG: NAD(P)-dependent oxidoreductase [Pseudomonadota bacterium]